MLQDVDDCKGTSEAREDSEDGGFDVGLWDCMVTR